MLISLEQSIIIFGHSLMVKFKAELDTGLQESYTDKPESNFVVFMIKGLRLVKAFS